MSNKTKTELEEEIKMRNCQEKQRAISNSSYASKKEFTFIQKIVFSMIAMILMAVLGAIINLVVIK